MAKYRMRRDGDGALHRVVIFNGVEGFEAKFSRACTGCTEAPESTSAPERGMGCRKCGYAGRRREQHWVPFDLVEAP